MRMRNYETTERHIHVACLSQFRLFLTDETCLTRIHNLDTMKLEEMSCTVAAQ